MSVQTSPDLDGTTAEAIINHALDIVVSQGIAELTLRPLAQRVGASVAVISKRIGAKNDLVERVIAEGRARDQAFSARWLNFAAGVGLLDHSARATLADLAFRDWLTSGREQAFLLIELVHECALLASRNPLLDQWLDEAGRFWAEMLFGECELADLALGYVLDEVGFALRGEEVLAFGLLRRLCLQRFVCGVLPSADCPEKQSAIPRLIELLKPIDSNALVLGDAKRRRIAECAAQIIVSEGIAAVTHRSVALAAEVPASTVVYHFGARSALVVAGLHSVILRYHSSRTEPNRSDESLVAEAARGLDLVKATSLVALASAREPSLLADALDMRRRRGENISAEDAAELGLVLDADFDRPAAQTMSIALFGLRMIALARGEHGQDRSRRAFEALSDWRERHIR